MTDSPIDSHEDTGILVPVGPSVTLRNTVGFAIRRAVELDSSTIHFVAPVEWRDIGDDSQPQRLQTQALLDRVAVWAREDIGEDAISVTTTILGTDEYLFSPDDYAEILQTYGDTHDISRVIVDPEYSPGGNVPLLRPMEVELVRRGFTVEETPIETPIRRSQIISAGSLAQFGTIFAISFIFYQLLGGFAGLTGYTFDLITGVISATIVATALYRVTLSRPPKFRQLFGQIGRLSLFVPYLLYEIVKSNIAITFIILHPSLPIDPQSTKVRTAVWGGPALTTLANSITLTPGTLTVRSKGQDLYVHTLFPAAREGLFEGTLERAVRFVFYGRQAAAIATPAERDEAEVITENTQGDG